MCRREGLVVLSSAVPSPKASQARRILLVVLAVVLVAFAVAAVPILGSYLRPSGVPSQAMFYVYGSRAEGYTASFELYDAGQNSIVSDGTVSLVITDGTDRVVYQSSFDIHRWDFQERFALWSSEISGYEYRWEIPSSLVQPGTPDPDGRISGTAKLTFKSSEGVSLSGTVVPGAALQVDLGNIFLPIYVLNADVSSSGSVRATVYYPSAIPSPQPVTGQVCAEARVYNDDGSFSNYSMACGDAVTIQPWETLTLKAGTGEPGYPWDPPLILGQQYDYEIRFYSCFPGPDCHPLSNASGYGNIITG